MDFDAELVRCAIIKGYEIISSENNNQHVTQSEALKYMMKQNTQEAAFPFLCLTWSIMRQTYWKQGFDSIVKDGATELFQDQIIDMWKSLPSEE